MSDSDVGAAYIIIAVSLLFYWPLYIIALYSIFMKKLERAEMEGRLPYPPPFFQRDYMFFIIAGVSLSPVATFLMQIAPGFEFSAISQEQWLKLMTETLQPALILPLSLTIFPTAIRQAIWYIIWGIMFWWVMMALSATLRPWLDYTGAFFYPGYDMEVARWPGIHETLRNLLALAIVSLAVGFGYMVLVSLMRGAREVAMAAQKSSLLARSIAPILILAMILVGFVILDIYKAVLLVICLALAYPVVIAFVSSLVDGTRFTPEQLKELYAEAGRNLLKFDFASLFGFGSKPAAEGGKVETSPGQPGAAAPAAPQAAVPDAGTRTPD